MSLLTDEGRAGTTRTPPTDAQLDELVASMPPGVVVTDRASTDKYRLDHSGDPNAGWPAAVVRATGVDDVRAAVRWAARHTCPVVTRGAGTGLSGGAMAREGGLVISTALLDHVTIDAPARVADVGPGALNVTVKERAAEHGLWYPPDPGSFRISSIGGNIATNAGGLCCVKYGVTASYVIGLDVVLPDGSEVSLGGRTMKNVAGLPLLPLFVGSEGTLGVITRASLRLVPLPSPASTMVAVFASLPAAGEAVVAIGTQRQPSMLELIDRPSINLVEDHRPSGLDRSAAAMLIAQSDAGEARGADVRLMAEICADLGATEVYVTDDHDEGELFVETRRATGPAVEARGAFLAEDVAVPVHELPVLLRRVEDIADELGLEIPIVAHAGDGNVHPAIIFDPTDPSSVDRSRQAFERVMRAALDLGGTITGEHGVGRAKLAMLATQLGPEVLALSWAVKAAIDPLGIMNPGVLLPPPAARR